MKQSMITLFYNTNTEEGEIKILPRFQRDNDDPDIWRLDCLGDWIAELQKIYDEEIEIFKGTNNGDVILSIMGHASDPDTDEMMAKKRILMAKHSEEFEKSMKALLHKQE